MSALEVDTDFGRIRIRLHTGLAPATCNYFSELVVAGQLANASVFRVVAERNHSSEDPFPIRVVQFGRMPRDERDCRFIAHESTDASGLRHIRGAVSAARFRAGEIYPSFFVCLRDEPELDYGGRRQPDGKGFAVFGSVVSGLDVVDTLYGSAESSDFLAQPLTVRISLAAASED